MHQKQLTQSLIVKTQLLEHSCSTFTVHGCLMAFFQSKCLVFFFGWFLATLLCEGFTHAESNHCSGRCGPVSKTESLRFADIPEKTPHQGSCCQCLHAFFAVGDKSGHLQSIYVVFLKTFIYYLRLIWF